MLNFAALTLVEWLYIIIGVLLLAVVILGLILYSKVRKHADPRKNLEEQQPSFADPLLNKQNEMFISVPRNVTYNVGVNGQIKPGAYILRNAVDKEKDFNVRYNGLVTEFKNETKITLGEGDTICCVSDSMVIVADL